MSGGWTGPGRAASAARRRNVGGRPARSWRRKASAAQRHRTASLVDDPLDPRGGLALGCGVAVNEDVHAVQAGAGDGRGAALALADDEGAVVLAAHGDGLLDATVADRGDEVGSGRTRLRAGAAGVNPPRRGAGVPGCRGVGGAGAGSPAAASAAVPHGPGRRVCQRSRPTRASTPGLGDSGGRPRPPRGTARSSAAAEAASGSPSRPRGHP